jgi:tetratricopeptide (TPR) repeat protein
VSDFGFDAYALDGDDAAAHSHPLEIARDLIATGKPRSALEVLSLHHDELAEDPGYLLICSEAWWAVGDELRAQQALVGAARLAPEDPAPLQLLGDLLRERGEHARAEQVLARAHTLGRPSTIPEDLDDFELPAAEDDLIAFAERQERSTQAGLTPKQVLAALVALLLVAGLVVGIVLLTRPTEPGTATATATATAPASATATATASAPASASAERSAEGLESGTLPPAEPVTVPAPAPALPTVPVPVEPATVPAPAPKPKKPVAKAKAKPASKAKRSAPELPAAPEPSAAVVATELGSMDAPSLTRRADQLYRQGHSGVAASYYRRALEIDPDYAPALVGMGRGILRAEKYTDAMNNATRALQHARGVDAKPGLEAEAIYQIGRVHLHRGELDAARRLFRQSISLPGTPPAAWFYLGEALWNDNSPAAREAYQRYLALVPEGHLADRARRAIR